MAGRVTVPFNVKLDNSPGPISLELDGGAAAPVFCAPSGVMHRQTAADASSPAFATLIIRPKTRSFTRRPLACLARIFKEEGGLSRVDQD